jgi:hypothetical protein
VFTPEDDAILEERKSIKQISENEKLDHYIE